MPRPANPWDDASRDNRRTRVNAAAVESIEIRFTRGLHIARDIGPRQRPGRHGTAQDPGIREQLDVAAQTFIAGREPRIGMRQSRDPWREQREKPLSSAREFSRPERVGPANEAVGLHVAFAAFGLD